MILKEKDKSTIHVAMFAEKLTVQTLQSVERVATQRGREGWQEAY